MVRIDEIYHDVVRARAKCKRDIVLSPVLNVKMVEVIGDLERAIKKLTIIRVGINEME